MNFRKALSVFLLLAAFVFTATAARADSAQPWDDMASGGTFLHNDSDWPSSLSD